MILTLMAMIFEDAIGVAVNVGCWFHRRGLFYVCQPMGPEDIQQRKFSRFVDDRQRMYSNANLADLMKQEAKINRKLMNIALVTNCEI